MDTDTSLAPNIIDTLWSRFKETAPEKMFETVRDEVFPFIKTFGSNGDGDPEDSTYTHHMKDALFMMPTPRVLANVVDQLDSIDMSDADTKGDLYEYMLGKIASAGQNGQFRTPRHIIKLMVDMTAPTPKDVICDPACGTAGFLIGASEYLVEHHRYVAHGILGVVGSDLVKGERPRDGVLSGERVGFHRSDPELGERLHVGRAERLASQTLANHLVVPDLQVIDLSDDHDLARVSGLTTVRQSVADLGALAARRVLARVAGSKSTSPLPVASQKRPVESGRIRLTVLRA